MAVWTIWTEMKSIKNRWKIKILKIGFFARFKVWINWINEASHYSEQMKHVKVLKVAKIKFTILSRQNTENEVASVT
jgi:hypothetical protein